MRELNPNNSFDSTLKKNKSINTEMKDNQIIEELLINEDIDIVENLTLAQKKQEQTYNLSNGQGESENNQVATDHTNDDSDKFYKYQDAHGGEMLQDKEISKDSQVDEMVEEAVDVETLDEKVDLDSNEDSDGSSIEEVVEEVKREDEMGNEGLGVSGVNTEESDYHNQILDLQEDGEGLNEKEEELDQEDLVVEDGNGLGEESDSEEQGSEEENGSDADEEVSVSEDDSESGHVEDEEVVEDEGKEPQPEISTGEEEEIDKPQLPEVPEVDNSQSQDNETGVEIEVDEYGNTVAVFAPMERSAVTTYTLQDTRLPSSVTKAAGTVSHFGETKGGVDCTIVDSKKTEDVQNGKYEFQGTANASLIFTGGILDAKATVSQIQEVESGVIKLHSSNSVEGTIREFLVKAANETIDDINGLNKELTSATIGDRTYLVLALSAVLMANSGVENQDAPLKLTFRDLDSLIPKQTTIDFTSALFTTSIDFVKNIINENSLVNNLTSKSNVNLNAEGIAVNLEFKAASAINGLKTNTRYEFVAPNKDIVFYPDATQTSGSSISYVEGLTMTQFKTGKQVPIFEAYTVSATTSQIETISTIAISDIFSSASAGSYLMTSIDFNSIGSSVFIDYNNMVSAAASNISMKVSGTNIMFKTLRVFDQDDAITKMEIEDDRQKRYPVTLALVDENDKRFGAYPRITGLERSTPYMFRKLHVTAQHEDEPVTKIINLVTLSCAGGMFRTNQTVTAIAHNLSVRTSNFSEPKLFIELDPKKAYVKPSDGSFQTSSSGNTAVYIPKMDVELPNKIKMPAVKNDKDALRYVIEVENTDVKINDLIVNGLKGNEQFKVEKIEGKDITYFILTLFDLSEDRDYGFLILELSYTDIDGRDLITRQVLSDLNKITQVNITGGTNTGIRQFPDTTLDNTTGPELTGIDVFNVTLFPAKTLESRKAEIPVFIDDIKDRLIKVDFKSPESNPNVKLEVDGSLLRFINLEPNSEVVYKIDFIWKDKDNKEQTLSQYAKISTPKIPAVDVKETIIKTTDSKANIVFSLYSEPKSTIKDISLSDENIKFVWNTSSLTLDLTNLKPDTEYKDLEIIFNLENGLITRYKIDPFKTQKYVEPPKGAVAEFVSRIYSVSLGREPEVDGWKFWVQKLESKELPVTQFIYDLMKQDEFVERYLSKEDFIKMMYQIVVGRDPEEEGQKYWESKYDEYKLEESSVADTRIRIASEMMNEQEFKNYVNSIGLKY